MPDYYIEADPTNTYLSTNTGNRQSLIWDDSTQTGEDPGVLYYDSGLSLTFINAVTNVILLPYDSTGFDTGYAFIYWDVPLGLGDVEGSVIFSRPDLVEVSEFTATNTVIEEGDATSLIVLFPSAVIVPSGGSVRVALRHSGSPTTLTVGGELSLDYARSSRQWWVGVAGWGG